MKQNEPIKKIEELEAEKKEIIKLWTKKLMQKNEQSQKLNIKYQQLQQEMKKKFLNYKVYELNIKFIYFFIGNRNKFE